MNEDVELAALHKNNSAEFLQGANLMIQSYMSGRGLNLQPQQGGQE